tara:strand:- start:2294 stop:2521 length:228 start_codon:yes stop_codon:yes gene_type:complete
MIKLFKLWFTGVVMNGTVDQINDGKADVEILARDGHSHEDRLPIWLFPCRVEEGTRFSIKMAEDLVLIQCKEDTK